MITYKYHNNNMTHIYSSKILLFMSITLISMFHILPYMMYLTLLVKILLRIMDLNMAYKPTKLRNTPAIVISRKIAKSGFRSYLLSGVPYAPFFPLYTLILYKYRPQQPQPPLPRSTHTIHFLRTSRSRGQHSHNELWALAPRTPPC